MNRRLLAKTARPCDGGGVAGQCFHRVRESSLLDVLGFAPGVSVPTLVAWGRHDHTMPPDCAHRLMARLPRARLYLGPGSHDAPNTRPRSFARAVLDFTRARLDV